MLYAKKLFEFFDVTYGSREDRGAKDLIVWTSTMVRTGMTVAEINNVWEVIKWRSATHIYTCTYKGRGRREGRGAAGMRGKIDDGLTRRLVMYCVVSGVWMRSMPASVTG